MYYWSHFALLMVGLLVFVYVFFWLMKRHQKKKIIKKEPILNVDINTENSEQEVELDNSSSSFEMGNFTANASRTHSSFLDQREQVKPSKEIDDIISLTIMAKNGEHYSGYELLQALLTAGFRYGEMNVFHRHENIDGTGETLFSLAQAVAPGSFDLSDVGSISCPGLTLFMQLDKQSDPFTTLDLMIDTAKQLVEDLGGVIYDDSRQPLTLASTEKWRAQIAKFQTM